MVSQASVTRLGDWLLTHLVALAFLAFIAVAWGLWGDFFPTKPSAPEQPEVAVETKELRPVVESSSDVEQVEETSVTESESQAEFRPVTPEEMVEQSDTSTLSVATSTDVVKAKALAKDSNAALAPEVVTEDKMQLAVPPKKTEVSHQDAESEIKQSRLQDARREFWKGDLEASEAAYLTYLQQYPEDANAFGELGNLYQSMGKVDEALNAYVEAGVRFKLMAEYEQLSQIVELLRTANDPRADDLQFSQSN